jgi:hypothetical protein
VLSIARIYGYDITLGRARELIATFGIGMAARIAFQQLSKLGGVPGWMLSASIAAATTVTIGYAAMQWFSTGERPTQETLQRIVMNVTGYLKDRLMGLGQKKPDRETLRERIAESLSQMPQATQPGGPATSAQEGEPGERESQSAPS